MRWLVLLAAAVIGNAAAADAPASATAATTTDVLDRPAQASALAAGRLLLGVAHAGNRLVAVGPRGHIVASDDAGKSWQQAQVPVSSDLTAVFMLNERRGWAVGHDGVVLATADGGGTWTRQLDGRAANEQLVRHLQARVAAEPASKELAAMLAEAERYREQGPDKPFLDVWFADENNGYVVGAYNLIFATADGGRTWEPWFDRTDNPKYYNLYAIRPAANGLYIAGEGGTVLKLDAAARQFRAVPVDYRGSLLGVADAGDAVLVYGLRGHVFRSSDAGRTWSKVDSALPATIVSGTRSGSDVVLADQGGRLVRSNDGGRSFARMTQERTIPITSIADAGQGALAATGPTGVRLIAPAAGGGK